jgi:hypothetical protein
MVIPASLCDLATLREMVDAGIGTALSKGVVVRIVRLQFLAKAQRRKGRNGCPGPICRPSRYVTPTLTPLRYGPI